MPAGVIREMAHAFATAPKAMICWTLGITEHHNAVDNVLALINLALLTGHVGRWGSGINPLRGQNNVQGGGDMGALPDRLPGFQHVENDEVRARFEAVWGVRVPPERGWHLTGMFDAMERKALTALYVIGENPAQSEADQHRTVALLRGLDTLVVQDVMFSATAALADVVLPAAASAFESEGTVTSSERRVQRVRRTKAPAGESRGDLEIIFAMARQMGADWGVARRRAGLERAAPLSPVHAGMSYARLEALHGLQWPCYDDAHPGEAFLHSRLWERPVRGPRAPFSVVVHELPVEGLDDEFPLRLTTGRRLEEYNTGVQTAATGRRSAAARPSTCRPRTPSRLGFREGQPVRVRSRRGEVVAPVHIDPGLRPGLTFMTLHFPDDVATNHLTIDATDPEVGHGGVQGRGRPPRGRGGVAAVGHSRRRTGSHCGGASGGRRAAGATRQRLGGRARATPPATAAPRAAAGRPPSSSAHLLLPALHAVQDRVGWVSRGALNYICRRLIVPPAEAWGVLTFYHLFATAPRPPVVAHVCDDIACRIRGAEALCAELERRMGPAGAATGAATWMRSPCLGQCDRAPAVLVVRAGATPTRAVLAPAGDATAVSGVVRLDGWVPPITLDDLRGLVPQSGDPGLALLRRVGVVDPGEPRRLPRLWRLPGAGPGDRDRSEGHRRRTAGGEAARARRRGVSHREEVGGGGRGAGAAALRDLQRRRVRARHLQGPRAAARRPVRRGRGDDHLRHRHPQRTRFPLHPRGVSRVGALFRRRHRRGPRRRPARRGRRRIGTPLRHRGASRRRGLHLRRGDGALQLARGPARRAALEAAVPEPGRPLRPADRGQQRRDPGQRARHPGARRGGVGGDRHRRLHRHPPVLPVGPRRPARAVRVRVRPDAARGDCGRRRGGGRTAAAGGAARRRRRGVRRAGVARRPDDLRGRPRRRPHPGVGGGDGVRRPRRSARHARPHRRVLRGRELRPVRALPGGHRPSARAARTAAGRRGRDATIDPARLQLLTELGQAMRDASICGLGQTASAAIESAVQRLHVFRGGPA